VGDAPSDQFVLLVGATEAGTEAHDLGLSCKAADALGDTYDVDALHVKSDNAMKMTLRADTPAATIEKLPARDWTLVDQLVAADDYATAARLLYVLRAASTDADLERPDSEPGQGSGFAAHHPPSASPPICRS